MAIIATDFGSEPLKKGSYHVAWEKSTPLKHHVQCPPSIAEE